MSLVTYTPLHEKFRSVAEDSRTFEAEGRPFDEADMLLTFAALDVLGKADPTAMFLHFGNIDITGHAKGFHPDVPEYMRTIEITDRHVGKLLRALRSRPTYGNEDWLILVCTDHGGQGTDHAGGHDDPDVNTTFLIVSGPSADSWLR